MRNNKQFKRDNYLLNITKEASVFIMLACAYFNDLMSNPGILILVILSTMFMLIPRKTINEYLDKGERAAQHNPKLINMYIFLNITKFISLILLTLYIFLNTIMMQKIGIFVLILITSFLVVPRRLIYILAEDDEI